MNLLPSMGDFYITWEIIIYYEGFFLHNMGELYIMGDFYITCGIIIYYGGIYIIWGIFT